MTATTIIYNSSSGSDTAASGSNAPTTAVTGTNGDLSGASVLTLNSTNDLTGSSVGDVVWYEGNTGDRHLYTIASFTGGVATCTAIVVDQTTVARTAKNWAVGGKRATLDSDTTQTDIADQESGWAYELEGTGLTYPIAATQSIFTGSVADGHVEIRAASGATPTITWTGSFAGLTVNVSGYLKISNVDLNNSTSASTSNIGIWVEQNGALWADGCAISTYGSAIYSVKAKKLLIVNCDINASGVGGIGINITNGRTMTHIQNCVVHNCGSDGITQNSQLGLEGFLVIGCIIRDNGSVGLRMKLQGSQFLNVVQNNVFHANSKDGIEMQSTVGVSYGPVSIVNNIFTNNSKFGIQALGTNSSFVVWEDYNAFRSNTSGETTGITQGSNDVTMTADPYTDEATNDYTLNTAPGGGASCRDAGFGYSG